MIGEIAADAPRLGGGWACFRGKSIGAARVFRRG
jgi:hypothetical protein